MSWRGVKLLPQGRDEKTSTATPTRSKFSVFRQLCNLIPTHLVAHLARATGVEQKSRSFTPWSHVVSLLFAQFTHAVGLNDVSDSLRLHSGPLSAIHVVDSTTLQLVAAALDWAKHRRRKAAAKCRLRLDLHSFLPRFALIDTARDNDAKRAREVCAGIRAGEIVLFDKAYVDFAHLHDLNERGVFWVTRAKDNLAFRVVTRRIKQAAGKILRDDEIRLTTPQSRAD